MPFEIRSTRAFVTTNIARKDLLLQMYVGNMLISDRSSGKSFRAFRTFVWPVATMTPGMSLHTIGIAVASDTTAKPAAKNFIFNIVCSLQVLM